MRESLAAGLRIVRRVTVDQERTISFMGESMRVYATPWVVSDAEYTCRDMILAHLDDGEDSVGTHVEIDHLAPTLLGMWAEVSVTVARVEGRRVTFDFTVRDAVEEVAKGRHVRFVVDVAKTAERLAAKVAQIA